MAEVGNDVLSIHKHNMWFNRCEWQFVYRSLCSNDVRLMESGLTRMTSWVARMGKDETPVAIQVTHDLLNAYVNDLQSPCTVDDTTVKMIYGIAVSRFVNLITDAEFEEVRDYSLDGNGDRSSICQNLGIPDTFLSLRHQFIHSAQPTLQMLRSANQFCLQWIKENYWDVDPAASDARFAEKLMKNYVQCQIAVFKDKADASNKREILDIRKRLKKQLSELQFQHIMIELCTMEYLIPSDDLLSKLSVTKSDFMSHKTLDIHKCLLEFWDDVLNVMTRKKHAQTAVEIFISRMTDPCSWHDEVLMAWIQYIIKTAKASCLDGVVVLRKLVPCSNKHTLLLSETVFSNLSVKLEEDVVDKFKNELRILHRTHESPSHKQDEIMALRNKLLATINDTPQQIAWSSVPIGQCPNVEFHVHSLKLSTFVDDLPTYPPIVLTHMDEDNIDEPIIIEQYHNPVMITDAEESCPVPDDIPHHEDDCSSDSDDVVMREDLLEGIDKHIPVISLL